MQTVTRMLSSVYYVKSRRMRSIRLVANGFKLVHITLLTSVDVKPSWKNESLEKSRKTYEEHETAVTETNTRKQEVNSIYQSYVREKRTKLTKVPSY